MKEADKYEFDHRGAHFRIERKGNGAWRLFEGNTLIDRIPANRGEKPTTELIALAKRVVNSHLDGQTPRGS